MHDGDRKEERESMNDEWIDRSAEWVRAWMQGGKKARVEEVLAM